MQKKIPGCDEIRNREFSLILDRYNFFGGDQISPWVSFVVAFPPFEL
jgi:hypothetical protein